MVFVSWIIQILYCSCNSEVFYLFLTKIYASSLLLISLASALLTSVVLELLFGGLTVENCFLVIDLYLNSSAVIITRLFYLGLCKTECILQIKGINYSAMFWAVQFSLGNPVLSRELINCNVSPPSNSHGQLAGSRLNTS